jgi:hypothetical protein
MSTIRLTIALFLCNLIMAQTHGVRSLPPGKEATPKREAAAIALVNRALQASGGESAVSAMAYSRTSGTFDSDGQIAAGPFTWEVSGNDFRYDNPNGSGRSISANSHGVSTHSDGKHTEELPGHITMGILPLHLPLLVLSRQIIDSRYSISLVNEASDQPTIHIHSSRDTNAATECITSQDWFFESRTGMPIRLEYRLPDHSDASVTVPASVELLDYRIEQGVLLPHTIVSYVNGQKQATVHITAFELNRRPESPLSTTEERVK